jgi:hypothetical protein
MDSGEFYSPCPKCGRRGTLYDGRNTYVCYCIGYGKIVWGDGPLDREVRKRRAALEAQQKEKLERQVEQLKARVEQLEIELLEETDEA